MPRISEIWRIRLILIGLTFLSLVPVLLQQMLNASEIYDIRLVGGMRPIDITLLRTIGYLSDVFPAIFICHLLATALRPNLSIYRVLLAVSVGLFLIYLILFLFQAVQVIELRVPEHYSPLKR
jgi:hypothetical protein